MVILSSSAGKTIGSGLIPEKVDIYIFRGDSFDVTANFFDSLGDAVPLAGFTGLIEFIKANGDVAATPTVTLNAAGVQGAVNISLLDTSSLTVGEYSYGFSLTDGNGKKRTFFAGTVEVTD